MFDNYVALYEEAAAEGHEVQWNAIRNQYSEQDFWKAISAKVKQMNREAYYPFGGGDYYEMHALLADIQTFINNNEPGRDPTHTKIYGRNNSDQRYKDLIDLAKVIALYHNQRNYHKYLLGEGAAEESLLGEKLYLQQHSALCAIPCRGQFDLFLIADFQNDFEQNGVIRNFLHPDELIDIDRAFGYRDSPMYATYQVMKAIPYCEITKSTYYALKAFAEVVSNQYDAEHLIDGCCYRARVNKKEKAFYLMGDFLNSLSPQERIALNRVKIGDSTTFGKRFDEAYRGSCVSQFADDITKLLCQCDPEIQFTNPRALQIKRSFVPNIKGSILDTEAADRKYLEDLCKVILHTQFSVKIGTKVTSPDNDELSNRVPSHVAALFDLCQKGLERGGDPAEARYKAVTLAAQCYQNPHNSWVPFFNTRQPTTQNFYSMVIASDFTSIIAENEFLHEHPSFLRRA